MMNYIKSEFYRGIHTGSLYGFTGILVFAAIFFNVILYVTSTRYATVSFSYSNLVGSPMIFGVMGVCIVYLLYEEYRRNGNLKNAVSFGISRTAIFVGQCLVSLVISMAVMVIVLAVWIGTAEVLLDPLGPVNVNDLLMEIPAVFLIAAAMNVSAILSIAVFEKSFVSVLVCTGFWLILPRILFYLGLQNELIRKVAGWFPDNLFLFNGANVNMNTCITIWDTPEGFARCLMTGGIWFCIFIIGGIVFLRRKDF